MRRVSRFEWAARRFVLASVAPVVLEATHRASRLAETRLRRSTATRRHVRGSGIEVGAAATPALVPLGCRVTYVDKYGIDTLRRDPELAGLPVRPPDILASAEKLEGIADRSQDFVLAFSLLEHVQDALGAVETFCRVTRPGGAVVLSVPDRRRYGPDRDRPVTEFEHFLRDYREGPAWSLPLHFREIGVVRRGLTGEALERFVEERIREDAHTHFHVWEPETFLGFLLRGQEALKQGFEIVEFASYGHEALAVLKVLGPKHAAG